MKTVSLKTLMLTISFFLYPGLLLHAFGLSFGSLSGDKLVSLRLADAPLRQALEMLAEQAHVDFVFYDELVKGITVTCKFEEIPLEEAIRQLLKETPISFLAVSDNQIVLVTGERHRKVLVTGHVVGHVTGPAAVKNFENF